MNLSKEQYKQLLNHLRTLQVKMGASDSDNSYIMLNGAVNLAGILACYSSITDVGDLSCKCVKLNVDSWIIDTGASHHMTTMISGHSTSSTVALLKASIEIDLHKTVRVIQLLDLNNFFV